MLAIAFDTSGERKAMANLRAALSSHMAQNPSENLMVLADGVKRQDNFSGLGEMRPPGGRQGGRLSAIFLGNMLDTAALADTMLHEAMHNLGAVRNDAPHSTLGGHLFEGHDVMQQGGGSFQGEMIYPCAQNQLLPLDCGGDDYYNPNPSPGSPMADAERNTYLSPFMASCQELGCAKEQIEDLRIDQVSVRQKPRRGRVVVRLSGYWLEDQGLSSRLYLDSRQGRRWKKARSSLADHSCYARVCMIDLPRLKPGVRYRAQVSVAHRFVARQSRWVSWRQR